VIPTQKNREKIQKKSKFFFFEKWLKSGCGGSKIQRLKFDNIFSTNESLVDKEIQFEENKFKIGCLRT
jgi:hypothetical protein